MTVIDNPFEEDNPITIEDILQKIYARRGVWYNPEEEFRKEIFERNCKYLEAKGVDPVKDPVTLNICMKADYGNLLDYVDKQYWKASENLYITWRNNSTKD